MHTAGCGQTPWPARGGGLAGQAWWQGRSNKGMGDMHHFPFPHASPLHPPSPANVINEGNNDINMDYNHFFYFNLRHDKG